MKRDKNLIPLSHQHQHALALCVRIDRAQPIPRANLSAWQTEIGQLFEQEISFHFAAEEAVLFPAGRRYPELIPLIDDLLADHIAIRRSFAEIQTEILSEEILLNFAQQVSAHIRNEERQLFERLQQLMTASELKDLGTQLDVALKNAAHSCAIGSEMTRLQPK